MKPPTEKRNGGPVSEAAAIVNPAKDLDVLGDLSSWLRSRWLRHYVLFSALGGETDREQMVRLGTFIDALKGVQK